MELCQACGITMEYNAPNMLQQNGLAERKIVTNCDHDYAMHLAPQESLKSLSRAEAASTAMKLSNLAWKQVKGIPNDLFNIWPGHLSPMQLLYLDKSAM